MWNQEEKETARMKRREERKTRAKEKGSTSQRSTSQAADQIKGVENNFLGEERKRRKRRK
jgi:hypothetical protein